MPVNFDAQARYFVTPAVVSSTRYGRARHFDWKNTMVLTHCASKMPHWPRCVQDASGGLPDASQMPLRYLPDASQMSLRYLPDVSKMPPRYLLPHKMQRSLSVMPHVAFNKLCLGSFAGVILAPVSWKTDWSYEGLSFA